MVEQKKTKQEDTKISVTRILDALPIMIPVMVATFGIVAITLLLFGELRNIFVWPIGAVASFYSGWFTLNRYEAEKYHISLERKVVNLLVVFLALGWASFNGFYTSQHVFTDRDPATYSVAGAWLVTHDKLQIPIPTVIEGVKGVSANSAGFNESTQKHPTIVAQGMHLLPVLIGLIGRIVGSSNMLRANVIFGAAALLSIYAFARLLVRPRWALLSMIALAVSLPFIYFSRDTYTEPLAATFTFGALALIWHAQKTRSLVMWFLAGIVAGAGTLTRIDGYLTVLALCVFIVIMLAISDKRKRNHYLRVSAWFGTGMAIPSIAAWFDLTRLSTSYYTGTRDQVLPEMFAIALVLLVGAAVVTLAWRTNVIAYLDRITSRWRAPFMASLVVIAAVLLASRPLWYVSHSKSHVLVGNVLVARRNYYEFSTQWVSWYIGPFLAILGVIGIASLSAMVVKKSNLRLLAAVLVLLGTSLLYLTQPNISPDQIWAARRLVPVILPGLVIFGVFILDWLDLRITRQLPGKLLIAAAGTLVIASPLMGTLPFIKLRPFTELAAIKGVCEAIPSNSVVLWRGMARLELVQSTEAYCNVPSLNYSPSSNLNASEAVALDSYKSNVVPIIGVYGSQLRVYFGNNAILTKVTSFSYDNVGRTYTTAPRKIKKFSDTIYLGVLQSDGSVRPLPAK